MNGTTMDLEASPERQPSWHDPEPRDRHRGLSRTLFLVALACFALPFLTVTCYGENVTLSGVQAATGIDLPLSDPPAEAQLADDETVNLFALLAFGAVMAGVVVSLGTVRSRIATAVFAAVGVTGLVGLYLYAAVRSVMHTAPRVGLAVVIMLLLAAGWLQALPQALPQPRADGGRGARMAQALSPRVAVVSVVVALLLLPPSLMSVDAFNENVTLFLSFYGGVVGAVALSVGAIIGASRSSADRSLVRPSVPRTVAAVLAGVGCVAVAGLAAPWANYMMTQSMRNSSDAAPTAVWTGLALVMFVMASLVAWIAGLAIVNGGQKARAGGQGSGLRRSLPEHADFG